MADKTKDFCFLWYVNDWMGGTDLMTREQKGAYHDLLMAQATNGHLSERKIELKLNQENDHYQKYWLDNDDIKSKFAVDPEGLFYNVKLEEQILKRTAYRESRKNNLRTSPKHMGKHVEKGKGKGKEKKIQYTENVSMTETEHKNLLERHYKKSPSLLAEGIEILDAYKESSGKRYKSDAGAMRGWVKKQMFEKKTGEYL